MKLCFTSYVIRKRQIKTTVRYHYTPIGMAKIQNIDHTKCWLGFGAIGTLVHCWWECKMVQPLWKTVWKFLTKLTIFLSGHHTPWYLSKWVENLRPHKNLHIYIHSSFIYNCQYLEAIKMFFNRWVVVHPDNGILFSTKNKWVINPWKDMEETYTLVLLSEKSQSEQATSCLIPTLWHSRNLKITAVYWKQ